MFKSPPHNPPYVVAVANRKGGTAKTTTALNLGSELAARGLATLIIDLDTQGHIAQGFGISDCRGATAHDLFTGGDSLGEAVRPSGQDHLWFVPADRRFDTTGIHPEPGRLARALRRPEMERFDFVVLDTPPSLDPILTNALAAADGVLVPFTPSFLDGLGVLQLLRALFRAATRDNPGLRLLGVVPTRLDSEPPDPALLSRLEERFGSDRVLRGIRHDPALARAFAKGQPVREAAPRSRGAMDYYLLSEWFLTLVGRNQPKSC